MNTLNSRFSNFLSRATAMHGNKFDYSQVRYIKAKSKIKIICSIHGLFEQTPDKHLAPKSKGCPKCWEDMKSEVQKKIDRSNNKYNLLTKEEFLERVIKKFNSKFTYDLLNYTGITGNDIEVTCPLHGKFLINPRKHLYSKHGCEKCRQFIGAKCRTLDYPNVIQQLKEKHNNYYEYPHSNQLTYKNKRSIIDIICPKHGLFKKKCQKHLSGQGCFQCRIDEMIEENILVGGYSEALFKEKPDLRNESGVLYYLEIKRKNSINYKIGITKHSENERIKAIIFKAKYKKEEISIKPIAVLRNKTLYECFQIEQKILNDNDEVRISAKWSTELFKEDIYPKISQYFDKSSIFPNNQL